ncbi:MAG: Lrp/AsnC family transcriptional regulator [Candidatus Parvarchaeota archaeon]|nr:Lrp/AsnC family transcriptional regulator [Candidatus Parvarchaeota archaeon]MCW1294424.1 Lrp/AsnC family transcriptional regulator [Candidatus Parvarchaeum tengchongense]MCW1295754.1 Lrp/AsnC family transcriptional regulator [Candidatus Parvarchaeum tengchongense]MCW1299579.1 Lrp/AsnC family transcriptional regulator [Candidatus Parvarchaeum tengchongense]MCW1311813.1 Lrp/AsnC family transcriptional regulator [Candidatus Parvarchaeum tengchongense]
MKLKEIDVELLDLFKKGEKVKEITKKLNVPQSTVYYHYNKLRKNGFIKGLKVEMDYDESKIYEKAFILVSLNSVHTTDFEKFFQDLKEDKVVKEIFEVSGDWDFILSVSGQKEDIINFVHEKLQNLQNVKKIQSIFIMRHVEI